MVARFLTFALLAAALLVAPQAARAQCVGGVCYSTAPAWAVPGGYFQPAGVVEIREVPVFLSYYYPQSGTFQVDDPAYVPRWAPQSYGYGYSPQSYGRGVPARQVSRQVSRQRWR